MTHDQIVAALRRMYPSGGWSVTGTTATMSNGSALPTVAEMQAVLATPEVPSSVTARQAHLAVLNAGLIDAVETLLADPANKAAQIEWEYASAIERNSPLIATLAPALGLSDAQIDDLFIQAATL